MHCSVCFTTSGSSHTLLVSASPAGRRGSSSSGSSSSSAEFRQGCLCLLHFGHAGWPARFCAWRRLAREWGGGRFCVWRGVCWRSPTQQRSSSHLLCPSLPAFFSVPDWSTTPEPTTTSSLPPHTHTHAHTHGNQKLHVCRYAKEFLTWVSQLCSFFSHFYTHRHMQISQN